MRQNKQTAGRQSVQMKGSLTRSDGLSFVRKTISACILTICEVQHIGLRVTKKTHFEVKKPICSVFKWFKVHKFTHFAFCLRENDSGNKDKNYGHKDCIACPYSRNRLKIG